MKQKLLINCTLLKFIQIKKKKYILILSFCIRNAMFNKQKTNFKNKVYKNDKVFKLTDCLNVIFLYLYR